MIHEHDMSEGDRPIVFGKDENSTKEPVPPLIALESKPTGTWSLTCQECHATSGEIPNGESTVLEHFPDCSGATVDARLNVTSPVIDA